MERLTKEPQYSLHFDVLRDAGRSRLGLGSNATWNIDPSRLAFVLSRYKFVSRMLDGLDSVVEIGCGDGFASRIVRQRVRALTVTDFDPLYAEEAAAQLTDPWDANSLVHDFVKEPMSQVFSGAYGLDVLEHISVDNERVFLRNIVRSLSTDGVLILGMPSLESQAHASPASLAGHINCKSAPDFKALVGEFFSNVFMFSMNDEVVHTGFHPMSHYLLALGVGPKAPSPPNTEASTG